MKLAFNIVDWQASAAGLSESDAWQAWGKTCADIDITAPLAKSRHLPMMTARRLASGSRLAVDCALAILSRQKTDALVFSSRHGELERNFRILTALAQRESLSPTDFAMSVHNSAVGNTTITAQQALVSSSVSAGYDSFAQALVEVASLHHAGYQRVLLVDFDGLIPEFYHDHLAGQPVNMPFAVGLLLEAGSQIQCETVPCRMSEPVDLPQGLVFLHGWLSEQQTFTVAGERLAWHWSRH
ncbi:beta-ketoacyl synthase chain length factor [Buttiauxella sp. B2]|uniref:beta-ketoacyl synthase chain length factor n=1 Tax=Buttiauxella sp. B2 TaxID=2587812 RepID=UPI0011203A60|nr:beta-ketoacyl synthase chain length factor [Buttiauxella sp. B2]TNV21903.1 beta-ketoacyl synthase chain length factor [Buttiauxella sp. B2]